MSKAAPAIPLFGDAYMADTTHLSLEEDGAYLRLMMIAWRLPDCALPDDDTRLARMLKITPGRWAKLKPVIMSFWNLGDKGWQQARLSKERNFVEQKRATNRASAEARWNGQVPENKGDDECERISGRNAPPPTPPVSKKKSDANASLPTRGSRLTDDWVPSKPLPLSVQKLVDLWPEGRLQRELEGFRDYWTSRSKDASRPDWDKTWWNRIRDQHDRIMRENRSGLPTSHTRPAPLQSPSLALLRYAQGIPDEGDDEPDRETWPPLRAIG